MLTEFDDAVAVAPNTLLVADDASADRTCADIVGARPPSNLVVVTVGSEPSHRLSTLQDHLGSSPSDGVVIAAGAPDGRDDGGPPVHRVENPADLTSLGIELSQTLQEYPESSVSVCFDSLTGLLAYTELERTFRFLHVVTNRIASVDARGHFHLDPAAHDEQTVDTLTVLFDAVVECDGDHAPTVQTR